MMTSLIEQQIKSLRVQSAWLPDIVINDPFAAGPTNPALAWLKPKVTLETKDFGDVVVKPYGEPGVSSWPVVVGVVGLVVVGLVVALGRK